MISELFTNPVFFVVQFLALILAIGIHEFSHAFTADRLGDPTPRLQGRVNLNPLRHIDQFGMLFLLFMGFGWGKPVQFDPFNLKNPRKDSAIISVAGPLSNFGIAIACAILLRVLLFITTIPFVTIPMFILSVILQTNLLLGVFNLLPIHPLDGFQIVGGILSPEQAREWYKLERYGYFFLILLILPVGGSSMLYNIMNPILDFFIYILLPRM